MDDAEDVTREVTRDCLVTRTRQISRVLTGIYDQELRPHGVNSPQFSLLVVISRLGPVSRAEIGRQNHQERSTLTRNLQLILAEGWAEEVPHGAGGRSRPIALTEAGRELLRTAAPAWRAAQDRAKSFLGEVGAGAVLDIADVLARSANSPAPTSPARSPGAAVTTPRMLHIQL
jgi:DNA-binding MarR family transcriptional regulator